jgi:uncharacterized membrane protein
VQRTLLFSHLVGLGVYLGATTLLLVLLGTLVRDDKGPDALRERLVSVFRAYSPLAIGSLGIVVMSGAWSLTPYKQQLGPRYFAAVGGALAVKLPFAFLLIMVAAWIAFGICHRMVRAHEAGAGADAADLARAVLRLRVALWLALALSGATLWVALGARTAFRPG